MQKESKNNTLQTATELLNCLWLNIDFETMSKTRRMKFQDEFTSKIRGCATSSSTLPKFIESVCKKLNILSIANKKDIVYNATALDEKEQQEVLKIYREQLIRVMNDLAIMREIAKEEYKKKQEERKAKSEENAKRREEFYSQFNDEDCTF